MALLLYFFLSTNHLLRERVPSRASGEFYVRGYVFMTLAFDAARRNERLCNAEPPSWSPAGTRPSYRAEPSQA